MAENTNTEREAFLKAFDAEVEQELKLVSSVPHDSNEICKWFAANLRNRLQARASLSLPAAGQEPVATGANWEQLRGALAMLMLGWLSNPNRSMEGCNAVLNSVTEPGMPLAILRSAPDWRAAPQPAVAAGWVMVPRELSIDSPILDVLIDWLTRAVEGECVLYTDMWATLLNAAALPPAPSTEGESNG